MADVTTMDRILWPLMHLDPEEAELVANAGRCVVCGRAYPLNKHHIVRRGAGELYEDGRKLPKAVVTLCGSGNTGGCHGLAHANRLHFRNDRGRLEHVVLDEPTPYVEALEMDGWEETCGERLRRLASACC